MNTALARLAFPALLAAGLVSLARQEEPPVRLVAGELSFEWQRDWPRLPQDFALGNTHGCIVVDAQDHIYLNTDREHAVVVFDTSGKVLRTWGKELAGGLHGMALVERDGEQHLLLTHIGRHQVFEATLEGEILWTLDYPKESGIYESADAYRPTSIAPLPDGGFVVADGYGASWIHRYDAQRNYVGSFGGPGTELGKLSCPHGITVETVDGEPRLLVSDRENNRVQVFDLQGQPVRAVRDVEHDLLRRPCHLHGHDGALAVADLAGRVTLLDRSLGLIGHLGDQPDPARRARNDVPRSEWAAGEFLAPHCVAWDSQGNLYVTDWVSAGRITKLARAD
jgi:DNA-binding beta-propeller fold protein YncE